jgi:hypothetical protein
MTQANRAIMPKHRLKNTTQNNNGKAFPLILRMDVT